MEGRRVLKRQRRRPARVADGGGAPGDARDLPWVRVVFEQSGGYAGLVVGCELDTRTLPAAEAAELERLVAASGLAEWIGAIPVPGPGPARDLRVYVVVVECGPRTSRAVFDDATVPAPAEPLLEFLQDRARPRPPTLG